MIVFRTTMRQDDTMMSIWMDSVKRLLTEAENEGGAYGAVAAPEAMALATRWIMPSERKLLVNELQRMMSSMCTFEQMRETMTFKDFDEAP